MRIFVAFVAVISVVGALPQSDDLFVKCTPPSYTARMYDALQMRVVSTSVDSDRSLSLIQADNGNWLLTDYQEGVVYGYANSSCTRARLPNGQALTNEDIRNGSEWMYSFTTEGGGKYSAWYFDNGSVKMEGLFDRSCVSRVTKVFMGNQINAVYFMYNINHVQPDLTELEAKLALAQDPTFCPILASSPPGS